MPEGHTIHRLARDQRPLLVDHHVSMSSPQGRFVVGASTLDGRLCETIDPYGKHLFYGFEGDVFLHVHLGLYGKWSGGTGPAPEPRGALRLRMIAGDHWLDLRGPTACEVYSPEERDLVLARLGPDPLQRRPDGEKAWNRISRSRSAIGQLLMDQAVLAGVGNVYRAEALFRARMSPFRAGRDVTHPEWQAMWADLVLLLKAGVKAGRIVTTLPADRDRGGRVTRDQAHYVYRRNGLPCRVCGTEVLTQVMAGRNLFWCPVCQAV